MADPQFRLIIIMWMASLNRISNLELLSAIKLFMGRRFLFQSAFDVASEAFSEQISRLIVVI